MLCKLCLEPPDEYISFKNSPDQYGGPHYAQIVTKYFYIHLEPRNNIICLCCWQCIKTFHEFSERIIEKQKNLQNICLSTPKVSTPEESAGPGASISSLTANVNQTSNEVFVKKEANVEMEFIKEDQGSDDEDSVLMCSSSDGDTMRSGYAQDMDDTQQTTTSRSNTFGVHKKALKRKRHMAHDISEECSNDDTSILKRIYEAVTQEPTTSRDAHFDVRTWFASKTEVRRRSFIKNSDELTVAGRQSLVRAAVEFYLSRNKYMNDEIFTDIAEQVCSFFVKENQDTYFNKVGSRLNGRLYNCFKNTSYKLRKEGLFPSKKPRKANVSVPFTPSEAFNIDKEWLKFNCEPWDEVQCRWQRTAEERLIEMNNLKCVENIICEWPLYKQAFGSSLPQSAQFQHTLLQPNQPRLSEELTQMQQKAHKIASSLQIEEFEFSNSFFNFGILKNSDKKEDLQRLLEQKEKIIWESFQRGHHLTNANRVAISKTIIQYMLRDPSTLLSTSQLENLSATICEIFPGEVPTTYYQKYSQGKHASGKLHDAYNNHRTRLAEAGLIVRRSKSRTKAPPPTPTSEQLDQEDENDTNVLAALEALKTETIVEKITDSWEKTFHKREKNRLKEKTPTSAMLKEYPVLEQPDGYKLFLIDVRLKYNKNLTLFMPKEFTSKIINLTRQCKSQAVSEIVDLITEEKNDTTKGILGLMLLAYLFPISMKRGIKGAFKPTRAECANTFISHLLDVAEANATIEAGTQEKYQQPRIFFIGRPVQLAWVLVAHLKYTFEDLEEAVKCAMAAYLGLNLKYPAESEKAWFFLQKHIFNISTSNDVALEHKVLTQAFDLGFGKNAEMSCINKQ